MTSGAAPAGDRLRDKPYGAIFAKVRERWASVRTADVGPPPEGAAPQMEALARFCRRLGAVPKSWGARRAGRAVDELIARMAQEACAPPEEVRAMLAAHCSDEQAAPLCGERPLCPECPVAAWCDYPDRRLTIKDLPSSERPRERLIDSGEQGLSDVELLAIIIRDGSQGATALDLAARLLSEHKTFRRLAECSTAELTRVKGIGPAKAAQVKAALAIARRYAAEKPPAGELITASVRLFQYMREKLFGLNKEHFYALMLDTKNRLVREECIAVGSLNESVVHPREVFKSAIRESAAKVIFVHNHPSGNPEPSPQDRHLTARLCEAGRVIGIPVLDHMIVGQDGYFSFAEQGLIAEAPGTPS
jgi:DNA repair protein RadC